MFEIDVTATEAEIILRAFRLARASGAFPDPAIDGDSTRINVLEQQIERKLEQHRANSWGGSRRLRKPGVIS